MLKVRRGPVAAGLVLALAALVVLLAACGGGSKKGSSGGATSTTPDDISGTYLIVQDSDGTKPKADTTVTLVLDHGKLTVHAVSPNDELTDDGTYSIGGGKMTISFRQQGISAKDQPFALEGDSLTLPVKMFSEGAGSSTWARSSASVETAPTSEAGSSTDASPAPSDDTPGVTADLKTDWSLYDLDNYATAAAMKTFVEGVNDKGLAWEDAVNAAAEKAKTFPDVTSVKISPNGLNATITYNDGRDEDLITERFSVTAGGASARGSAPAEELVSTSPVTASSCPALAAAPTNVAKVGGQNLAEPGREGLQPRGGYGVSVFDPKAGRSH